MAETIKVFLVNDTSAKYSVFKFGSSKTDFSLVKQASIKESLAFPSEGGESGHRAVESLLEMDPKKRKRKESQEKRIASHKSTVLTLDLGNSIKSFSCRQEEGALENASYFILRRVKDGLALTPISTWYSAIPSVNYRTLNDEEAELEFGRHDRVDSVYSNMIKKKLGIGSDNAAENSDTQHSPRKPKSPKNGTEDDPNSNPDSVEYDYRSGDSQDERKETLTDKQDDLSRKFTERLSESESDEELNEQGKELKKMLTRLDSSDSSDDASVSNNGSASDEDIDQLEKKYSKSKIFLTVKSASKTPPTKTLEPSLQQTAIQISESLPTFSTTKTDDLERFLEEKIKLYLARQPINTVTLLKKLLSHAPPGHTREQVVYHMANVLKRIGIKKRVISGKTYLELNR